MTLSPITPFSYGPPTPMVTPFTYGDNFTYLKLLETLRTRVNDCYQYVTDTINSFNVTNAGVDDKVNTLIDKLNSVLADVQAEYQKETDSINGTIDAFNANASGKLDAVNQASSDGLAKLTTTGDSYTSQLAAAYAADHANLQAMVDAVTQMEADAKSFRDAAQKAYSDLVAVSDDVSNTGDMAVAYFRENDEVLRIASTSDGKNFYETGFSTRPSNSAFYVRDPSIDMWGSRLVAFHTMPEDVVGDVNRKAWKFGVRSTVDGNSWTEHPYIDVKSMIPGAQHCWAPDQYTENGVHYLIFSVSFDSSQPQNNSAFHTYEMHTSASDITQATWSTPTALNSFPTGIDAHIQKLDDGSYLAFYSAPYWTLNWAKAQSLTGPWTDLGVVSTSWPNGEGPYVAKLKNGGKRLFFDAGGYVSVDFDANFTVHGQLTRVPFHMRHLGMCPIATGDRNSVFNVTARTAQIGTLSRKGVDDDVRTYVDEKAWHPMNKHFNTWQNQGGLGTDASWNYIIPQFTGMYVLSASIAFRDAFGKDGTGVGWVEFCPSINDVELPLYSVSCSSSGDSLIYTGGTIGAIPLFLQAGDRVGMMVRGDSLATGILMRSNHSWFTLQAV